MSDYKEEADALNNELNEYFFAALGTSFGSVDMAKKMNQGLAIPIIAKYGSLTVTAGLAWLVRDIKAFSETFIMPKSLTTPGNILNDLVVGRLMSTMAYMHDLVEACGENGQQWLLDSLAQYHEDIRALAAYFLADNVWKLDADHNIERVKQIVDYTIGTSCQIALSLALFMAGDRQLLRSFLNKEYFGTNERYCNLEQVARQANPNASRDDLEMTVVLLMVVPETLGATPATSGLLKMLALDIESNGKSCRAIPDWKRKQYPE